MPTCAERGAGGHGTRSQAKEITTGPFAGMDGGNQRMTRHHTPTSALALLYFCLLGHLGAAQEFGQPDDMGPLAAPPAGGVQQAIWMPSARQPRAVRFSDYVDVHGDSVVVPAGYFAPPSCVAYDAASCGYGSCCDGGQCGCGQCGCQSCGGAGCNSSMTPGGPGYYGDCPPPGTYPPYGCSPVMADMAGAGSLGLDQCGPHYFDVRAEFVYMTRTHTFDRSINFTSLDPVDPMNPGAAVYVLNSDDLNYDFEPAFRVTGRYDLGPLSVAEFSYFGLHDMRTDASYSVPFQTETIPPINDSQLGNLYSLFSQFGQVPNIMGDEVIVENGAMGTTDRAIYHGISLNTDLQTAEITYRRYWVGYNPRVSGTVLFGARYTRLSEQFKFATMAEEGDFDYSVDAENDIVGFQTGGDVSVCLMQGLRLGAEGKAGIYNNRFKVGTQINSDPFANSNETPLFLTENDDGNNIAFIGETSLDLVIDVSPSCTLRGGYEVLWINSVALASDNFNTTSPFGLPGQPTRIPFTEEQENVLYHGFRLGAEYIW